MNDEPRRTLRVLIAKHGTGLCSDARRCEGLLRDLCGEHRREINILVGALRERVPLDLLAGRNTVPAGLLLTRLSKRLEDQLAVTAEASRWAVYSWALALGVVSEEELDGLESRRVEAVPPRVEERPKAAPPRPTVKAGKQGRPSAPASQQPAPPAARPPSTSHVTHAGGLQEPSANVTPRVGLGRRRGCLVGCLLLLLLSVLLAAGAPFVVNILREEQQQRNLEPPPGYPR